MRLFSKRSPADYRKALAKKTEALKEQLKNIEARSRQDILDEMGIASQVETFLNNNQGHTNEGDIRKLLRKMEDKNTQSKNNANAMINTINKTIQTIQTMPDLLHGAGQSELTELAKNYCEKLQALSNFIGQQLKHGFGLNESAGFSRFSDKFADLTEAGDNLRLKLNPPPQKFSTGEYNTSTSRSEPPVQKPASGLSSWVCKAAKAAKGFAQSLYSLFKAKPEPTGSRNLAADRASGTSGPSAEPKHDTAPSLTS